MNTFSEIIDLWPTKSVFASECGVEYGLAHQWDRRNSIPPEHWDVVVAAAKRRKLKTVNLELLTALAKKRKQQ